MIDNVVEKLSEKRYQINLGGVMEVCLIKIKVNDTWVYGFIRPILITENKSYPQPQSCKPFLIMAMNAETQDRPKS